MEGGILANTSRTYKLSQKGLFLTSAWSRVRQARCPGHKTYRDAPVPLGVNNTQGRTRESHSRDISGSSVFRGRGGLPWFRCDKYAMTSNPTAKDSLLLGLWLIGMSFKFNTS